MTDILCKWLNEDIQLEPKLNKTSFPDVFSSGYLFGEILAKHGLQPDFSQFINSESSEAKLNNFTRLEPTFKQLEIPFNINMARDVMTEQPGVATRLLYQLFVALNRVKESGIAGPMIESMRPAGKLKLEKIETGIFEKRLKQRTPRQVDLNFEGLIQKFQERQRVFEEKVESERQNDFERIQAERKEVCHKTLDKIHVAREKQAQLYAKLKPLSPTKPPARRGTTGSINRTRAIRAQAEAQATREGIDNFEASLSLRAPPVAEGRPFSTGSLADTGQETGTSGAGPSSEYVAQIRKRVKDNELGRQEREKRRRKVLVEQMQALQDQENANREKMLVERLMRQCQQERRIATQLMAIRKEKETIRNNRIFRLQQYEEQRVMEFNEALDREKELVRCEEKEKAAKLKHHQAVYKKYRAHKAEANYKKNFSMCRDILLLMVDLATKLAHYRELTKGLVPSKLVVDWKTLFMAGKSCYEEPLLSIMAPDLNQSMASSASSAFKKDNMKLLDQADLNEYNEALHEWSPPESLSEELPGPPNNILSHIVYRLLDIVDPPQPPPPSPVDTPTFLLRAAVFGRPFAGKTTIFKRLELDLPDTTFLIPEDLVTKAVAMYLSEKRLIESQLSTDDDQPILEQQGSGQAVEDPTEERPVSQPGDIEPSVMLEGDQAGVDGVQDDTCIPLGSESSLSAQLLDKLSPVGLLGYKAHSALMCGESVDFEIVVEIVVAKLRSLRQGSVVIIDNFPNSIEQLMTLSKVIVGDNQPTARLSRDFKLIPQMKSLSTHPGAVADMTILFDVSTDTVLARASSNVADGGDSSNKFEQVQHRLMAFDTHWPQIKRFLKLQHSITVINAEQDIDSLYEAAKDKINDAINTAKYSDMMEKIGIKPKPMGLSSESSTKIDGVPKKNHYGSIPILPLNRPNRRSKRSSSSTLIRTLVQPSLEITETSPGDSKYKCCDRPVSEELATSMAGMWPAIESVYLDTLKVVFQQLRDERESICQYFHEKRTEFKLYLSRPDTKQEFVSQWQETYNSLAIHLRREKLMKAELHHRVDDLCEQLWDISDRRREGAVQERGRILSDKWLEDHIGLLTNHYIELLQAEIDRFYGTYQLLKDYYTAMDNKIPAKLPDPGRLALIELSPTKPQELPPSNTTSTADIQASSSKTLSGKSSVSRQTSRQPSGRVSPPKRRGSKVPLLARQPLPEPAEDKAPKKKGGGPQTPPPPLEDLTGLELDQQLVVHAYNTATAFLHTTLTHDMREMESVIAELSKPPPTAPVPEPPAPEPVKEEKAGKGKKAKSPAPGKKGKGSPAKGAKQAPVPDPPVEAPPAKLSPADLEKRKEDLAMYKEHQHALQHEEKRVKGRIELIKLKALQAISSMKETASGLGVDMEQWLDSTYKQEVDTVRDLAAILRQAIENEQILAHEIQLPGPTVNIKQSFLMVPPTPPLTPEPPMEPISPHMFTASQLHYLSSQLASVAPDGFILASSLAGTLLTLNNSTSGATELPDYWTAMNKEQLELMVESLYGNEADVVNWKRLIVALTQPLTLPTVEQLVATAAGFQSIGSNGLVTRTQFDQVQMWLDHQDRDYRMKQVLYDVFCDPSSGDLPYTEFLLSLCVDHTPGQGLLKALAVVTRGDSTVTLDELNKVLTHGHYCEEPPPISVAEMLDLFVKLNPTTPNEACVDLLQSNVSVWDYLTSNSPYQLTVLEPFLRPVSRQTETD